MFFFDVFEAHSELLDRLAAASGGTRQGAGTCTRHMSVCIYLVSKDLSLPNMSQIPLRIRDALRAGLDSWIKGPSVGEPLTQQADCF